MPSHPCGRRAGAWAALVWAAVPVAVSGQPQADAEDTGWPAIEIGARVGYDNIQRQEVLGALLRIPILRNGSVELFPNGDVTFLRGVREYQLNLEAVYLLSGREGGIYAGGGVGFRSTIPPSDISGGRETLTTLGVVVGIKFTGLERVNPLIEFRRVFADELAVDPQLVSLGATFVLW